MKQIIVLFFFLCVSLSGFSQKTYYDSIHRETALNLISTNPEDALFNVDFMYTISSDNDQRLKALLLKAELLKRYGIKNEAINILLKADSIAKYEKDYVSQTKINGLIATIYRESNLQYSGIKHLEKAKQISKKVDDKNTKLRFQGNLEQESACIEMDKGNYLKAINHIRRSNNYFLKTDSSFDIPYFLASNYESMSKSFLKLNELDSAFAYIKSSQEQLAKSHYSNSSMKGFIFNGFAEYYLAIKSYDQAEEYFLKAKSIADESKYFKLKKDVYRSISNFYKKLNQNDKHIYFNEQYLELTDAEQISQKLVADKLINKLYLQEASAKSKQQQTKIIISILISSLILLICLLSWYIYKKMKNQKKQQVFLEEKQKHDVKTKPTSPEDKEEKNYMSEDKEQVILQKLTRIEDTKFYLDEDISLSVLSSKIGINQRYLAYVIKKHKEADFSTYINELRINYIVICLRTDPKFLLYKISYLAELSGFSSHSRFTINFKKVTGTTPSTFIAYVKEENKKKEKSREAI